MIPFAVNDLVVPIFAISYVRLLREEDDTYSIKIYLNNGHNILLANQTLDYFERIKSLILEYENK